MKRRRYSKIRSAVMNEAWAILPHKLDQICELVESRDAGRVVSRANARHIRDSHPPLMSAIGVGGRGARGGEQGESIAVLNLYGTIAHRMNLMMEFSGGTSAELFGKAFDRVLNDDNVRAIVIRTDSPGGAVTGVPELADKIYESRGVKPIIAMVDPLMASAAYWIGSAADEIVSTPSALDIGSIGVLSIHHETSQRDAREGDTYTVIRSVERKAEGLSVEPLSDEARARLQERAEMLHGRFVAAVARNRGVSADVVNREFGQGGTLTADEALAVGMIDRIATFEELITELGAVATPSHGGGGQRSHHRVAAQNGRSVMDPKVRLALVQAGLMAASASTDDAKAALQLACDVAGVDVSDDVTAMTAAIAKATGKPPATPQAAKPIVESKTVELQSGLSIEDITGLVASAGASLPDAEKLNLQTELLKSRDSLSLSQVLDKINDRAVAASKPAGAANDVQVAQAAADKFHAAARDAIVEREFRGARPEQIYDHRTGDYVAWKPEGRNYGLSSALGIATQCLVMAGVPQAKINQLAPMHIGQLVMGADPSQLGLGGFLASSDGPAYNVSGMFANILLDAANVTLRRSFDEARATFDRWMGRGADIRDFKFVHRVIAGEIGDPKAIPEDGTFDESTLTDGKESYRLTVWGQVFSHSWQLVVNDQLDSFMETPTKLGAAMRRKINKLAYQALKDNANLSDGGALFNSTATTSSGGHGNLTTGALSNASAYIGAFNTMTAKMMQQKGLSSESAILNLMPEFVVLPPAIRGTMLEALGSSSVATSSSGNSGTKNIWQGALTPVEEGELSAAAGGSDTAFYLAANSSQVDTIEYAYLQGMPAPVIEQQTAFDRLAVRQRIYFAFGVKPLDFRGLQKHTGAAG